MGCLVISRRSSPLWGSRVTIKGQVPPDGRPPRRGRGLWRALGFLVGGPIATFGVGNVVEGARTIESLAGRIKAESNRPSSVRLDDAGFFDLPETAARTNTDVHYLQILLRCRRTQTARATKTYLLGGCGFLAFWIYAGLIAPGGASTAYILALIALAGLFFIGAFYNALVNWQVRTNRLGSFQEFLATSETWWPS